MVRGRRLNTSVRPFRVRLSFPSTKNITNPLKKKKQEREKGREHAFRDTRHKTTHPGTYGSIQQRVVASRPVLAARYMVSQVLILVNCCKPPAQVKSSQHTKQKYKRRRKKTTPPHGYIRIEQVVAVKPSKYIYNDRYASSRQLRVRSSSGRSGKLRTPYVRANPRRM